MRKRIYIETTVVSYFTARPSRDVMVAGHQEATRDLWPKLAANYESYVSALVYEEARRGDPDQAKMRLEAIKLFRNVELRPPEQSVYPHSGSTDSRGRRIPVSRDLLTGRAVGG